MTATGKAQRPPATVIVGGRGRGRSQSQFVNGGSPKIKRTVSLDPGVVASLVDEEGERNLSALVNALLHDEMDRRGRAKALHDMLDELETKLGPADERLVTHYADLLQ